MYSYTTPFYLSFESFSRALAQFGATAQQFEKKGVHIRLPYPSLHSLVPKHQKHKNFIIFWDFKTLFWKLFVENEFWFLLLLKVSNWFIY